MNLMCHNCQCEFFVIRCSPRKHMKWMCPSCDTIILEENITSPIVSVENDYSDNPLTNLRRAFLTLQGCYSQYQKDGTRESKLDIIVKCNEAEKNVAIAKALIVTEL